jgi:hypothetical protein
MPDYQIIRSPSGEELVVLSRAEFNRLVALAADVEEDAAGGAAYDCALAVLADAAGVLPLAGLSALTIEGDSRLATACKWRVLSRAKRAAAAAVSKRLPKGSHPASGLVKFA